jgi:poly(3-hydroxybutyrate) depolymerase
MGHCPCPRTKLPAAFYAGGAAGFPSAHMLSVPAIIAKWAAVDRCSPQPAATALPNNDPNDFSKVVQYRYQGCASNSTLWFNKIVGGGHRWPGSAGPENPHNAVNRDIDASSDLWAFSRTIISSRVNVTRQIVHSHEFQLSVMYSAGRYPWRSSS